MDGICLQPLEQFNFAKPDEWPRWIKHFEQFRLASGLADLSQERQISTLLYCLGHDAEEILRSTNISEDNRKQYDQVCASFNEFFNVCKNVIFERARFNRRNQLGGESIEQYIVALYHLVEDCQYGAMKEELIRDRLVVGIRDEALSQKLQMDPKLTLEGAKKAARQREAVQEHQQLLKAAGDSKNNPLVVERVKGDPQRHQQKQRKAAKKFPVREEEAGQVLQMRERASWTYGLPSEGCYLSQMQEEGTFRGAMFLESSGRGCGGCRYGRWDRQCFSKHC